MPIYIYNTLNKRIEEFKPIKKGKVGIYACGPTVYNFAHIGNLRSYVFEDILKRVLEYNGYKVRHVINITDVGHLTDDADAGEDKMEKGSAREGKGAWEIAEFYIKAFRKDIEELNIQPPSLWCRATDHINEQIKLIKKLEKKGFVYGTSDGIYFDTNKLRDYGKIANLQSQDLRAGARVDVGDKKNITDFALWKFSPKLQQRQMEWDSPWGVGFPGWHIECSAMSAKYLGQPFDIHCGGIDHIPVHHTNEMAQSEAAEGKPLANYWMHGEFLITGEAKMAKSGNNFITLSTIKDNGLSPIAYRYLLLQTHYRKPLAFSIDSLKAAQNGLNHLYAEIKKLPDDLPGQDLENKFLERINDDLDTPAAIALVWEGIKNNSICKKSIFKFDNIFGLNIKDEIDKVKEKVEEPIPEHVNNILLERNSARANRDWVKSDELREQLESLGYIVKDTPAGTEITKA